MTRFLLIRHATNDWVGVGLAGHLPGVHLNEQGLGQAERLCVRLAATDVHAIYSSPLERALETAAPLAAGKQLAVEARERLIEIGVGEWTGRSIADLDARDELWKRFNTLRSSTRAPGGELITEVQTRMVDEMEELRHGHPDQTVALFSHGDVIKSAVAHFAGIPFDLFARIEISPASISVIELADWGPRILAVNDTGQFG